MSQSAVPFFRHIDACNSARLPGDRLPFLLGGPDGPAQVGWVRPELVSMLAGHGVRHEGGRLVLDDPASLQPLGEKLAKPAAGSGLFRWRDEPFDVRSSWDGPVLARLDRGGLPDFGILAEGVHLNGLVERPDGTHLWVGRRASDKLLDPGKLDHLVAGGIPAGYDSLRTLEKEGAEECGLTPGQARQAAAVGTLQYAMERSEGLRRDRLHCFDLTLSEAFQPVPHDGEVAEFTLIPLTEALRLVRDTELFKFNVNLVLIDLFLRRGLIDPIGADGRDLRQELDRNIVVTVG